MNDLIDLVRILTDKEIRQLRRSFNNSKAGVQPSRLGQFLLDIISNKKNYETNKEILDIANIKFGDTFIKIQRNKLFNYIEKFVFNNWLDEEANKIVELKVKKELLLLDYYKSKEAQTDALASNSVAKLIEKKSNTINKLLKTSQTDYLLQNFHLYSIKNFEYFTAQHSFSKDGAQRLERTINSLDTFYKTAKLKYLCEAYVFGKISGVNITKLFVDELPQLSSNIQARQITTYSKHVLLKIYTLIFLATQNLTLKNLQIARKTILANMGKLNDDELSHIITLMINLVTFLKRAKNIDLTKLTFELFKYGLIRKIFFVDGKINPLIILNYLFLSIEIKSKNELKIVEDYYSNIEPSLLEAIKSLKSAVNYFSIGEYKKAIETCSGGKTHHLAFRIYKKILLIMCQYELKDYELVESSRIDLLRDAGKHREELGIEFHTAIKNFSKAIKNLIKVNHNIEKIGLSVKNELYIVMRRWLIRKIKNI